MAGLLVLLVLAMVAITGKVLTEWAGVLDPTTVRLVDKLKAPLSDVSSVVPRDEWPPLGFYLLGTDELGRDVFARMLQGTFVSLSIGLVAVVISLVVGVALGALSGYYADVRVGPLSVDTLIMRFTDVMLSFPTFFLILTVVVLLPPSIYNIMIVIGLTGWMGTARFVRAEFLSLSERDFVVAAKATGLSEWTIITGYMLPNAMAPVIVSAVISVAHAILTESALSFLGFGVQPPAATWGNILADGKAFIFDAPWLFFIPGSAILVVVLAFNLFGEGLREAINPRRQVRK
ncbi:MAG: ABC transporter permease [Chromatiales bacterium]|nr:ABC transporter permease [Chromatiales bacterium]